MYGFQEEFKSVEPEKTMFPIIEAYIEWLYATTSGKLDHHWIDHTALNKFKKASHEHNTIVYIFIKA